MHQRRGWPGGALPSRVLLADVKDEKGCILGAREEKRVVGRQPESGDRSRVHLTRRRGAGEAAPVTSDMECTGAPFTAPQRRQSDYAFCPPALQCTLPWGKLVRANGANIGCVLLVATTAWGEGQYIRDACVEGGSFLVNHSVMHLDFRVLARERELVRANSAHLSAREEHPPAVTQHHLRTIRA